MPRPNIRHGTSIRYVVGMTSRPLLAPALVMIALRRRRQTHVTSDQQIITIYLVISPIYFTISQFARRLQTKLSVGRGSIGD